MIFDHKDYKEYDAELWEAIAAEEKRQRIQSKVICL